MSLTKPEFACENVLHTLKTSRLTFSVQETPFSAYVTIRKKFSQKAQGDEQQFSQLCGDQRPLNTCESFESLTQENSSFKSKNSSEALIDENKRLIEVIEKQNRDIEQYLYGPLGAGRDKPQLYG